MKLGNYKKAAADRIRFSVDYSQWLVGGEALTEYSFTAEQLEVDAAEVSGDLLSLRFFVSGGSDGDSDTLAITVSTSIGQVRQDYIIFSVVDPPT